VHPYLDWAIATNFAYLRPGNWLPLLVEFDPRLTRSQFTSLSWLGSSLSASVQVPALFQKLPPGFNFGVLLVPRSNAQSLVQDAGWIQRILRAEMGPPCSNPVVLPTPPASFAPGPGAWMQRMVVAVIDEGISFAHERFRNTANQTRIAYLWRQDAGIELTPAKIDPVVAAAQAAGENEEAVYRAIGGLDMNAEGYKPLARRHSHGTHVLDLASGYGPNPSVSQPLIIAVDMPEDAVGDPAGSTLIPHAAMGLLYVWLRAMAMRQPNETLPVVVNLSYGTHEGPHDGSSLFECFMDALIALSPVTETPIRIMLAAGNFRQSRVHAGFQLPVRLPQRLAWRLQPCGLTPSFMEIWIPAGAKVRVSLTSPSGAQLAQSPTTNPNPSIDPSGFWIKYVWESGHVLGRFVLCIPPTAQDPWAPAPYQVVPSGVWDVTLTNAGGASVRVDAWIKRSETLRGRRAKGRQSYFDDPAYLRYELPGYQGRPREFDPQPVGSYVQRQGTLSGIATGFLTYVMGAYCRSDQMPAAYSSEASGRMHAPDWLAPGDDAASCPGALGAGTRNGARVAMSGTSAATPQLTRFFAETWTGGVPDPVPPTAPVSKRVPVADLVLVAGKGLVATDPLTNPPTLPPTNPLPNPPIGRVWKNRP